MNPSPDRNGPPARDRGITARRMARVRVVVGGATIAVALAVALAAFGLTWSPAAPAPPSASSSSDPSLPLASPKFFRSDGPYIGEQRALDAARARASGPIAREEVHLLSYGAVVEWLASENLYFDTARESMLPRLARATTPATMEPFANREPRQSSATRTSS